MGGWFLAINPNSENKEAAAELVKYFTGYDQQLAAALDDNRAPTLPAVYDDPKMAQNEVLQSSARTMTSASCAPRRARARLTRASPR